MGYGFGGLLIAVGLIMALAVKDSVSGVDLTMVGWILAGVGVVLLIATAATLNGGRAKRSQNVTTHADGTQTVQENKTIS